MDAILTFDLAGRHCGRLKCLLFTNWSLEFVSEFGFQIYDVYNSEAENKLLKLFFWRVLNGKDSHDT